MITFKLKVIPIVILLLNLPHIFVYGVPSRSERSSIHSDNHALENNYNKVEEERLRLLIDAMKFARKEQVNPCEDYLDYVGSANHKNLNIDPDVYNNLHKEMYEKYIKNNNKLSPAESKLKKFFEHCESSLQKTYEEAIANLDFSQFGHFPLKEHEWNEDKFDWAMTQAKRQIFPDGGFLGINAKHINGKLKFSIKPILLSAYRFAVGDKHFDELFQGHGYSIEETTALQNTFRNLENDLLLAYESTSILNITIGEMNDNINGINWKSFFEIYSNGIAKDSDEVSITGVDAIRSYIDILSSKINKRDLANYVFYDIYETIRKGFNSMKHYDMTCFIIIAYNFDDVFSNIMLNHYLNHHDTVNIIHSVESVLKTFQNETNKIEKFHLNEVADVLRLRTTQGPKLDDAYKELNLTNEFILNLAEITRHKHSLSQPISPLVPEVCGQILKLTYNFHDKPRLFIVSILADIVIWDISKPYPSMSKNCYDIHRFKYALKVLESMKPIDENKFETEEKYLQKSGLSHNKWFFNIFAQYFGTDFYYDTSDLQTSLIGLKEFTDAYGCPEDKIEIMESICDKLRN